jgi:Holliday junction resolvase
VTYAKRTDANHAAIRDVLRQLQWLVFDTSAIGRGWPDLVALRGGQVRFVEVKDGAKVKSQQKLKPAQVALHAAFKAAGCPVVVVTSVEEAEAL